MVILKFDSNLESIVEGSWMGSRARAAYGSSDIGSAYSPPERAAPFGEDSVFNQVDIVLDVGYRENVCVDFYPISGDGRLISQTGLASQM